MKERYCIVVFAAVLALVVLAGCSPPFPKDLLDRVDQNASLAGMLKEPERFNGKLVMLGGTIVDTTNLKEGTRIEMLQRPLDSEGRPEMTDTTGGRFLIQTREFLDGAVYHRGRALTVIGEVVTPQVLPLGETQYRYPVVTAKALHLWSPYAGPRFSIGVGVYRGF